MNRDGKDIQVNRETVNDGSLPGFLGNAGKSKEVSSIFAAILEGGLHQGNESQGTIQSNWLATLEQSCMDIVQKAINFDVAIEMIAKLRSDAIRRKHAARERKGRRLTLRLRRITPTRAC
jgi:hypothetical protein